MADLGQVVLAGIGEVAVSAAELEQTLAWAACRLVNLETAWESQKLVLSRPPGAMATFKRAVKSRSDRELKRLAKEAERLFAQRGRLMHSIAYRNLRPDGQEAEETRLLHLNSWTVADAEVDEITELAYKLRDLSLDVWQAHQRVLNAEE